MATENDKPKLGLDISISTTSAFNQVRHLKEEIQKLKNLADKGIDFSVNIGSVIKQANSALKEARKSIDDIKKSAMEGGKLKLELSETDIAKINQGMTELQTAMTKASTLGMEAWARVDRGITRARKNQSAFMRESYHTNFQNFAGQSEDLVLKTQNENVKNAIAHQMNKKYSEYDWSDPAKLEEVRKKFFQLVGSYKDTADLMNPERFARFISEYRAIVDHAPASADIGDSLRILKERNMDKVFQKYFKDTHIAGMENIFKQVATLDDKNFESIKPTIKEAIGNIREAGGNSSLFAPLAKQYKDNPRMLDLLPIYPNKIIDWDKMLYGEGATKTSVNLDALHKVSEALRQAIMEVVKSVEQIKNAAATTAVSMNTIAPSSASPVPPEKSNLVVQVKQENDEIQKALKQREALLKQLNDMNNLVAKRSYEHRLEKLDKLNATLSTNGYGIQLPKFYAKSGDKEATNAAYDNYLREASGYNSMRKELTSMMERGITPTKEHWNEIRNNYLSMLDSLREKRYKISPVSDDFTGGTYEKFLAKMREFQQTAKANGIVPVTADTRQVNEKIAELRKALASLEAFSIRITANTEPIIKAVDSVIARLQSMKDVAITVNANAKPFIEAIDACMAKCKELKPNIEFDAAKLNAELAKIKTVLPIAIDFEKYREELQKIQKYTGSFPHMVLRAGLDTTEFIKSVEAAKIKAKEIKDIRLSVDASGVEPVYNKFKDFVDYAYRHNPIAIGVAVNETSLSVIDLLLGRIQALQQASRLQIDFKKLYDDIKVLEQNCPTIKLPVVINKELFSEQVDKIASPKIPTQLKVERQKFRDEVKNAGEKLPTVKVPVTIDSKFFKDETARIQEALDTIKPVSIKVNADTTQFLATIRECIDELQKLKDVTVTVKGKKPKTKEKTVNQEVKEKQKKSSKKEMDYDKVLAMLKANPNTDGIVKGNSTVGARLKNVRILQSAAMLKGGWQPSAEDLAWLAREHNALKSQNEAVKLNNTRPGTNLIDEYIRLREQESKRFSEQLRNQMNERVKQENKITDEELAATKRQLRRNLKEWQKNNTAIAKAKEEARKRELAKEAQAAKEQKEYSDRTNKLLVQEKFAQIKDEEKAERARLDANNKQLREKIKAWQKNNVAIEKAKEEARKRRVAKEAQAAKEEKEYSDRTAKLLVQERFAQEKEQQKNSDRTNKLLVQEANRLQSLKDKLVKLQNDIIISQVSGKKIAMDSWLRKSDREAELINSIMSMGGTASAKYNGIAGFKVYVKPWDQQDKLKADNKELNEALKTYERIEAILVRIRKTGIVPDNINKLKQKELEARSIIQKSFGGALGSPAQQAAFNANYPQVLTQQNIDVAKAGAEASKRLKDEMRSAMSEFKRLIKEVRRDAINGTGRSEWYLANRNSRIIEILNNVFDKNTKMRMQQKYGYEIHRAYMDPADINADAISVIERKLAKRWQKFDMLDNVTPSAYTNMYQYLVRAVEKLASMGKIYDGRTLTKTPEEYKASYVPPSTGLDESARKQQKIRDIAFAYSQELARQNQLIQSGVEIKQKDIEASERRVAKLKRDWEQTGATQELRTAPLVGREASEVNRTRAVDNAMAWQNSYYSTASSKVSSLTSSLERLYTELSRNPGNAGIKQYINQTSAELVKARKEAKEVAKQMQILQEASFKGWGHKLRWVGGAFGFYESYDFLARFGETITKVDEAMKNLETVMPSIHKNRQALEDEQTKLINVASRYGSVTEEIVESARLWGRMYKDQNTVNALTEQTAKLAIADNFSIEESTKAVEAAMFQFGMQAKSTAEAIAYSNNIIDVYTKLSHNAGVSAQDLAAGVERSGAVAHQAGMDFEFLTALVAQGTRATALSGLTNNSPFMLETA